MSFNLGISFPQIFNLKPSGKTFLNEEITSERISAIGFNFGLRAPFSSTPVGGFFDSTFYGAISFIQESKENIITYDLKDQTFWGIDGLLGAYLPVIGTNSFVMPIGIGIHLNYSNRQFDVTNIKNETNKNEFSIFTLGIGMFLNVEINISEKFAIYGGARISWDFFQTTTEKTPGGSYKAANGATVTKKDETETSSAATSMLYVTPALGVIIRL